MEFRRFKHVCLIAVIGILLLGLSLSTQVMGNDSDETVSETILDEEIKQKTAYLHNETLNEDEDVRTMNTTMGEEQHIADWTYETVTREWYLEPGFAGDFRLKGNSTIYTWIDITDVEATTNVLDLEMELYEVGPEGEEDHIDGAEETYDAARTIFNEYSVSTDIEGHDISAGSSLKVEFTIGASENFRKRMAFGDSEFPSRLEMSTSTYIQPETLIALNSTYEEKYTFPIDPEDEDTTIHFNASVTNPIGGYDVKAVYLTVEGPDEVIFYRENMELVEGDDYSYRLNYTYTWDYSGVPESEYTVRVSAVDNTGYHYRYPDNPGDESYGGHLESLSRVIWIGAERYHVNLRALDSKEQSLEGAEVQVLDILEDEVRIDTYDYTDEEGITNLTIRGGENLIRVYWQDVVVFNETIDVFEDVHREDALELSCEVYTPTYRVIDVANEPLNNVNLHIAHPNGTTIREITDEEGLAQISQLPGSGYSEEYFVRSEWLTKVVNETTHELKSNEMIELEASVYYLDVSVHDEKEEPVSDVHLTFRFDDTDRVANADLTDIDGETTIRLPETSDFAYDIVSRWRGVPVGEAEGIELYENDTVSIPLEIYYVDLEIVDGTPDNDPLGDARVRIYNEMTGDLSNSLDVDSKGTGEARLPSGDHNVDIYWKGVEVSPPGWIIEVEEDMDLHVIEAEVYRLEINVEDAEGVSVENAEISVTHSERLEQEGFITEKTTDDYGYVEFRLPRGEQTFTITWREVIVKETSIDLDDNQKTTIESEIYHIEMEVVDDRNQPIENAQVEINYTDTEEKYSSRRTDQAGLIGERIPAAEWDVRVKWIDTEIYFGSFTVSEDEDHIELKAEVYYLTVITEDSDGEELPDVHVKVLTEAFERSGYTENGNITFTLPARDDYVLEAHLETTYMLTNVEMNESREIILQETSEEMITFEDYPVPFYMTNLFYFLLALIVLVAILVIIYHQKVMKEDTEEHESEETPSSRSSRTEEEVEEDGEDFEEKKKDIVKDEAEEEKETNVEELEETSESSDRIDEDQIDKEIVNGDRDT